MNTKRREKIAEELGRFWNFLTMRRLSYSTRKAYRDWLWRFAEFMDARHLRLAPEAGMEAFLTHLAVERRVAASTQDQAFSALLSFFRDFRGIELGRVDALRAQREPTLRTSIEPAVLIPALLDIADAPGEPYRLIAFTLYGCGLRLNEGLNLRIRDLRLDDSQLFIRQAKHGSARMVPVPCALIGPLRQQVKAARLSWERDAAAGQPQQTPGVLARKYPRAPYQWQWAFLFPSARLQRHPDTGESLRWHVPAKAVQRAVQKSARKHELDGTLTPHVLRHCFADQFRDDVKVLQEIMGHKDVRTTMGYRHPRLHSPLPLDALAASTTQPPLLCA